MKQNQQSVSKISQPRKIIGFSLPLNLAAEVKVEAARRNISLRKLFTELWSLYRNSKSV
jgi:hypothetical protein